MLPAIGGKYIIKERKTERLLDQTKFSTINYQTLVNMVNKKQRFVSYLTYTHQILLLALSHMHGSHHITYLAIYNEFFPKSLGYTSFRGDMHTDTTGGGVFILVKDTIIATAQK